jgi:TPR repeat protein
MNGKGVPIECTKAAHYYKLAAAQSHPNAQYHYAICLINDNIVDRNVADAFRYLKLSAENGSSDGQFAVACMAEHGIGVFSSVDLIIATHNYEECSDYLAAGATCLGWCLQTGRGLPMDFTVAAECFIKSANSEDPDGINSFGCCLEEGRGVDADIERAVRYYRRAASLSHADGMYNFGRCLEYGKGIERNLYRAVKYYRLSSEQKNAAAENSFGVFLEGGVGVHKDYWLAAQYYHRAAQQGHPDGANNFGFCLEHGRGVEQNIALAAEYYKFAADRGHSEAKLNHRRCLRLLGRWEGSDRSFTVRS